MGRYIVESIWDLRLDNAPKSSIIDNWSIYSFDRGTIPYYYGWFY